MSYLPVRPNTAVALFQHGNPNGYRGMGEYERVGDWGWEFFGPNAFGWERPLDSAPQPAPVVSGLSGCGCGGSCGGCGGHKHGVGQAGILGTGCFASLDLSTWGWCEWGSITVGIYLIGSIIGDLRSAADRGKKTYRAFTR